MNYQVYTGWVNQYRLMIEIMEMRTGHSLRMFVDARSLSVETSINNILRILDARALGSEDEPSAPSAVEIKDCIQQFLSIQPPD